MDSIIILILFIIFIIIIYFYHNKSNPIIIPNKNIQTLSKKPEIINPIKNFRDKFFKFQDFINQDSNQKFDLVDKLSDFNPKNYLDQPIKNIYDNILKF